MPSIRIDVVILTALFLKTIPADFRLVAGTSLPDDMPRHELSYLGREAFAMQAWHSKLGTGLLAVAMLVGCSRAENVATNPSSPAASSPAVHDAAYQPNVTPRYVNVRVKTNVGDLVLKLDQQTAPKTVVNFLDYVRDQFYAGTIVHHAENGMIIAGGVNQELQFPPTRIPVVNEAENGVTHRRGTVAMAREPDSAHSATSQFFINLKENAAFNHQHAKDDAAYGYCVFGEVVAGLDVADRIAKSPTQPLGGFAAVPQPQVVIQEVTVE